MFPFDQIKSHKAKKARIESEAVLLVLLLKTRAYEVATENLRKANPSDQLHYAKVRRNVINKLGLSAHVDTATRYLLSP
jgi:hypothetical protein